MVKELSLPKIMWQSFLKIKYYDFQTFIIIYLHLSRQITVWYHDARQQPVNL